MSLKSTSVGSTRVSLPLGVAGSEPDNAPVGTLAYATDTEKVRVKKAGGWDDVGGGGAGTITSVIAGDGLAGGGSSGAVTLDVDFGTAAGTVTEGDDPRLSDSRAPTGAAGGDLAATFPNPTVAAVHTGATKLTIGTINDTEVLARSGTTLVSRAIVFGTTAGTFAQGNDSRLSDDRTASGLRTASTVVSISSATAPSVGQVLIATSGSAATWQTPAGLTSTGNPLIDLPASTITADSDEFTVDTLASGVWGMWNDTDSTAMSRVGNITWNANTLTGTQFNSEVRGSSLFVQVPLNKACLMSRTISTGAGMFTVRTTRNMSVANWGSNVGPLRNYLILGSKSGNTYDKNNFVHCGFLQDIPGLQRRNVLAGATTNDNAVTTAGANFTEQDTYAIRLDATSGNIAYAAKSADNSTIGFAARSGVNSVNLLTLYMLAGTSLGTPAPQQTIFAFDYVRRYPATQYIWG